MNNGQYEIHLHVPVMSSSGDIILNEVIIFDENVLEMRTIDYVEDIVKKYESKVEFTDEREFLIDFKHVPGFSTTESLSLNLIESSNRTFQPENFSRFSEALYFQKIDRMYCKKDSVYQRKINSNSIRPNIIDYPNDPVIKLIKNLEIVEMETYSKGDSIYLIKISCYIDFSQISDWGYDHVDIVHLYILPDYHFENLCLKSNISSTELYFK